MAEIFVYCYAAISSVSIITGLYFIFTEGKNND